MIRFAIFSILSAACGFGAYFYGFRYLKSDGLAFKLLTWPYRYFQDFLPPEWYFPSLAIFVGVAAYIALESIWLCTDEKPLTSRGSAHWATEKDVKDLMTDRGVPVGKFGGFPKKMLRIYHTHLVTCAPTRSGKGIGAIIPALLEYPQSLVCLDVKGENFAVTAARRRGFGKVFVLNPFGLLKIKSNSYNWLDAIDLNDESCIEKAGQIAALLVGRDSAGTAENHFDQQATRLLQGLILAVCADPDYENRNIVTVARLIHELPISSLCDFMISKDSRAFGVIASIGRQFSNNDNDKEIGSILSTAQRATNFLDDPKIKRTLLKSDFEISQLPDKPMTIYIIIPQNKIKDYKSYINIFFDLSLSSLVSRDKKGKYEVLFLLDEVAQLGFMENISNAISILKGLGGQLWFFFQSYAQMINIYGKEADNILGNSAQIFYGCNDIKTAKLLSESIGKMTFREYDKKNKKYNIIERNLISPNEIREMSPEKPMILINGVPPIRVKRLNYLKDKEYKGLFRDNPYFN